MTTQYHNWSASMLADALGECRAQRAVLEKREATIKAALDELGVLEAEGEAWRLRVEEHDAERLDVTRLRKKLPAIMLKPFIVRSRVRRYTTTMTAERRAA